MTAIEAIRWCLEQVNPVDGDGDICTRTVYDREGDPHWISWESQMGQFAFPRFCSGSVDEYPFANSAEPYRETKSA